MCRDVSSGGLVWAIKACEWHGLTRREHHEGTVVALTIGDTQLTFVVGRRSQVGLEVLHAGKWTWIGQIQTYER